MERFIVRCPSTMVNQIVSLVESQDGDASRLRYDHSGDALCSTEYAELHVCAIDRDSHDTLKEQIKAMADGIGVQDVSDWNMPDNLREYIENFQVFTEEEKGWILDRLRFE